MNADTIRAMIARCLEWHEGFSENKDIYYSRCVVGDAATHEGIRSVEEALGVSVCPELVTLWSHCATLDLEWFVKQRAAQGAGIDSRQSPMATFRLLSPEEVLKERDFLVAAGSPMDSSRLAMLPFCRVGQNRELLAINHTEGRQYGVELVVFDSELNRIDISDQFGPWLEDWHSVLFEEHHLVPGQVISHSIKVVVDVLSHLDFEWPPEGLKETPFESD